MQPGTRSDDANGAPAGRPDFDPIARRVLIIGLDGATFDVLGPLMKEGCMPALARAVEEGAAGTLWSTVPPITPAAWTTFLSGKQPGMHGILDFERYDPRANRLEFNNAKLLAHVRNLWHILGERGFRIGSINVPMTYPATPVNGFLISGFETPNCNSDFVYPKDLRSEILTRWSDPTLGTNWRTSPFGGDQLFRENVDYMIRSFHQGAEMSRVLGDKFGWDVLMVVLKLVDNLQHKTWKYIDPRWSGRAPERNRIVRSAFTQLDKAIENLLEYARAHDATVIMVSDHGHGSMEGKVQPNLLLKQWGYLTLRGGGARGFTRLKYVFDRSRGRLKKFSRAGDIGQVLALDFEKTRACVMHAGMAGFLYMNLKGRQPDDVATVEPAEYESLRDELRERFLAYRAKSPDGESIQVFPDVHKPEELYGCAREEAPWMPDLMLMPYPSLAVVRKIRGWRPVQWLRYGKIEGTHRPNGIFIASGPGIRKMNRFDARIADCAPTILAMMGLRIPGDMQGSVITKIFERPPTVGLVTPAATETEPVSAEGVYSEADLARITERLSDLGYLE